MTPQEIIQAFLSLKGYDKLYVLNSLSQEEKDPIVLERDKQLRRDAVKQAAEAGRIQLPPEQPEAIPQPPIKPENGVSTQMPLDPEAKAMFEAMQAQMAAITNAMQTQQQSVLKFQLDIARQNLLADVPEAVRPLVTGSTVEELQASAKAVKSVYGTLENDFKTKYAPPAPTEPAPPAGQSGDQSPLAQLQALVATNPDALNAIMTQIAQQGAAPAAPAGQPAAGLTTATQLPGQQPAAAPAAGQTPGAVPGMAPLNPLAPPAPDPLIPNPAAGPGQGAQLSLADVSSPQFAERYASDAAFRKQVDDEQRSRLGQKPLFVTNN